MYNLFKIGKFPLFTLIFRVFQNSCILTEKSLYIFLFSKMKIFTLLLFSVFLLEKDFDKKEREK